MYTVIEIIEFVLALAIYSRSPAAYEALKSFKLLQLPGISTLQDYKAKLVCEPGMLDHMYLLILFHYT